MARKKEKDWVKLNLSLDKKILERLRELANFENLTQSSFVELLVLRWDEGINPETKLNTLLNKRKEINNEITDIDLKIKKVSDQITLFNDLKRQKSMKKPQALQNIERHLLEGELGEAERISRFWQKETGTSAIELLMEARDNIKDKGI